MELSEKDSYFHITRIIAKGKAINKRMLRGETKNTKKIKFRAKVQAISNFIRSYSKTLYSV